jgi:hypothetical protein
MGNFLVPLPPHEQGIKRLAKRPSWANYFLQELLWILACMNKTLEDAQKIIKH